MRSPRSVIAAPLRSIRERMPRVQPVSDIKLLIIAHNHPRFFPGGAEIIAYDMFKTFKHMPHVRPYFMAGVAGKDRPVHTGTPFQAIGQDADEILFWGDAFDYFYQSQQISSFMYNDFKQFLLEIQPDVIHFHHTMRIGLEALQIARQALPNVKIVYTLHEFILMCHRDGQMVRTVTHELCDAATPSRCHQCYPQISPGQFKMREIFIKSHLELVDQFISPSKFLAQRFISWGIPADKMRVMENGRAVVPAAPQRKLNGNQQRNRFGFFGQINPFKGAMLVLKAVDQLAKSEMNDFHVTFFGNVDLQTEEFQKEFQELVEKHKQHVSFYGKYKNEDMARLMLDIDWIIVPSTWWENSPLVIQEAFMHQRPILCSNIGGMAEKVQDEVTGLHFHVRNEHSLARTMQRAITEEGLWEKLSRQIGPRLSLKDCAREHLELYQQLLS